MAEQTPLSLMLDRVLHDVGPHDPSKDDEILADARDTVMRLLTAAMESVEVYDLLGWTAPDDCVAYMARTLLLCPDLDELVTAVRRAQAIYVDNGDLPPVGAA